MRPPKRRTSGASKQPMLVTPLKLSHDRLVGIALVGDASAVRNSCSQRYWLPSGRYSNYLLVQFRAAGAAKL